MKKGNVIHLNGTSSSGKTTLAHALQEALKAPYYLMKLDTFLYDICPKKFYESDADEDEFAWVNALKLMFHTAKMYSDYGHNVIIDDVNAAEEWDFIDEAIQTLKENNVLFVHVECPLEELERREIARGDREVGLAKRQISRLYPPCKTYDVTVDTHTEGLEESVAKIVKKIEGDEIFTAYRLLHEKREKDNWN